MMIETIVKNKDCAQLQKEASAYLIEHMPKLQSDWDMFCRDLNKLPSHAKTTLDNTEKRWLMVVAFRCLIQNPEEANHLAKLSRLALYLKSVHGMRLLKSIFSRVLQAEQYDIKNFTVACQLLLDLAEEPHVVREVEARMPLLSEVAIYLKIRHETYLQERYPSRDIDDVLTRFSQQDAMIRFPLNRAELDLLKIDYLAIQETLKKLRDLPLESLKEQLASLKPRLAENTKDPELMAILVEMVRRHHKIAVHDTQLLSCLALFNNREGLKGRIGQIKTGEGKSTIIAILSAFLACQGQFVDVITSSDYLAIRDCQKYANFYQSLGITVSHICELEPEPQHFTGQVLYGTSSDFEFALLRDGLYHTQLRKSVRDGVLQDREFDVAINDEIDSLFLDMATNSALLSLPNDKDYSWVYPVIFEFANQEKQDIAELRLRLTELENGKFATCLQEISNNRLKKWLISAYKAIHYLEENKDYIVKPVRELTAQGYQYINRIVIMDAINTGRPNEGSQWQNGLTQFLEVKHHLEITNESLTAASLSHPTYFGQYKAILGLTGTMGEQIERDEIQQIYHVDSFDVPPHVPNIRQRLPSIITGNTDSHFQATLQTTTEMREAGRPTLILFETIQESEDFHAYLDKLGQKHQLINTAQRESEDYLVARAGEPGMITIATNAAGRGTDVLLAPESKKAGGLHVIFSFYPDNIRVEEQGFGRASRQGQPGSCNMILNINEKRIQRLIKKELASDNDRFRLLLLSTLCRLQGEPSIPDEGFIDCLDVLRREKIQEESKSRFRCAQQEEIFFQKLKDFFTKLSALHSFLDSDDFNQHLLTCCQQVIPGMTDACSLEELPEQWQPLSAYALRQFEMQLSGALVDWTSFLTQFKALFLQSARKTWANFYNKLHEEIGYHDETSLVAQQVDKAYFAAKPDLDQFLESPAEHIETMLFKVLYKGIRQVRGPVVTPRYS